MKNGRFDQEAQDQEKVRNSGYRQHPYSVRDTEGTIRPTVLFLLLNIVSAISHSHSLSPSVCLLFLLLPILSLFNPLSIPVGIFLHLGLCLPTAANHPLSSVSTVLTKGCCCGCCCRHLAYRIRRTLASDCKTRSRRDRDIQTDRKTDAKCVPLRRL